MIESHRTAWACPACTFRARAAAGLADHVSDAHFVADDVDAVNSSWRCPAAACESRASLQTVREFLTHLDQHLFGRLAIEPMPRRTSARASAGKLEVAAKQQDLLQGLHVEGDGGRHDGTPPAGGLTSATGDSAAAGERSASRRETVVSDDLDGDRQRTWRCPACRFEAATADGLAGHVRLVHVGLTYEEKTPTTWTCPDEACGPKRLENAKDLALHLEAHAIQQPAVAPLRRGRQKQPKRPCSISGCETPAIARGLCSRHYRAARRERRARGEEM